MTVVVDPGRDSWVPSAAGSGFPLQHLPYGIVAPPGRPPRAAVRIGERVLDLAETARAGLLDDVAEDPRGLVEAATLNPLLSAGRAVWTALRRRVVDLLAEGADPRPPRRALREPARVAPRLPIAVADYVDFYASLHHAATVGRLFRPNEPLADNWRHLPVAYHGRAGTVVVSGTPVRRPVGQAGPDRRGDPPVVGPTRRLDLELELGFVTGLPAPRARLAPDEVDAVTFGVALVNDWSARDLQAFESRPLGPFLGKSFATSVAAWITPLDALVPFRIPAPPQDPPPAPYLRPAGDAALDLELTAELAPAGGPPTTITRTNSRHLYWTFPQQLAHTTVNGATARSGDLYATGTVSGPEPHQAGCLLELSRGGAEPLELADGSRRTFLEDGDTVVLRGRATKAGHPRLQLAPVTGRVEAADG